MSDFQVLTLALIQGLTEFLPVSSSAHLLLPHQLLGWPVQGLGFDAAVHLGSLLAVLAYFRSELRQLSLAFFHIGEAGADRVERLAQRRLAWRLIAATMPVVVAGWLLRDAVAAERDNALLIAATTIVFGLLLWWSDRRGRDNALKLSELGWGAALFIGFAQTLALAPGVSRAGICLTAALIVGARRREAARFAFLLSIPVILAAATLELAQMRHSPPALPVSQMALGVAASAAASLLCISAFMRLIERVGLTPFVVYRLALGVGLLVLIGAGAI